MSNVILSAEDEKLIKAQQDNCPIVRFLRTRGQLNFSIGDYLIKAHKRDNKWEPETISSVSDQPKRFICIHEDEYGIKYIKPLTSLGKELPYIIKLTETSAWTRYEVDPEYAEHIILGDESGFDFSEKRKQDKARRDAITRKNKKIAEKITTLDQATAIVRSLKPGDKLWMDWNIPAAAESAPWIVVSLHEVSVSFGIKQTLPHLKVARPDGARSFTTTFTPEQIIDYVIIRTEPFKYETV